jgi:RND family efflux transporter MFP subunit
VSKRTKVIIGVVVLVVLVAVAGVFAVKSQGTGPAIKTAQVSQAELGVKVTASGKVVSDGKGDMYPASAGVLSDIYVSEGETVTAGDKIAQLDTAPLELQLKQARAGLRQAQAQLSSIDQQAPSSADVNAAKAAVNAAKAGYDAAKSAYDTLAAIQPTPPSLQPTLTAASNAMKQANAAYLGAVAQLKKVQRANVAPSKAAAQAAVTQANEAVSLAQRAIDDATLVAPITGRVIFNAIGAPRADGTVPKAVVGAAVSPAGAPFSVVDLSNLRFSAEVDEADIERVKTGMKASITLDAFPGTELASSVKSINPAAQPTATGGTVFGVELPLKDTGKDILIGMKGDANIEVTSISKAITIPVEALFTENAENFVYVVDNAKLKKTTITIGAQTDTEVEVVSGVSPGQVVALSGSTQYTDGMPVRTQ